MSENKKSNRLSRKAKQRRKAQMKTVRSIVIIGIVLLIAFVVPNLIPREITIPETFAVYSSTNDNSIGLSDAPVLVEEYSDVQCPHCKTWFLEVEPQLLESYVAAGLVRFEYHTAGEFLGSESGVSGEGMYCAGDQDKFWEMKEIVFLNQPVGSETGFYTKGNLSTMAEAIGIDVTEFDSCMDSNKFQQRMFDDLQTFTALGLSGTPSVLVNGVALDNPSIQSIANAVEAALAAGGN